MKADMTVKVRIENLAEVIADAVEEAMAAPRVARDEPLADWERELLGQPVPRVATSMADFEPGQVVSLIRPRGATAIAQVTAGSGGALHFLGTYLFAGQGPIEITGPLDYELERGHWLILDNPQEVR